MTPLFDSFWRAAAYCLHPRVILLSLLPLVITAALAAVLGYFFWNNALGSVSRAVEGWALVQTLLDTLEGFGVTGLRGVLAPVVVLALALPLLVIFSLVLVSLMMTPALVGLVAGRRFPQLQRLHGGSMWQSVAFSGGSTLLTIAALIVSVPFWLVPPLVMILPPLIWGWLTYRVMSFDALAEHATKAERQAIMRSHRISLLVMGVICGYLGAAPALVWAIGAVTLVLAPLLIVVSVWLYTLVFAFSALWFAHYLLAALMTMRGTLPTGNMAVADDRFRRPELPYRETP